MASLTLRVVVYRLAGGLLMWVVARKAANALIVRVVAFAAGQTIRLEANIRDTRLALTSNLFPGAMTLTAKVRGLFGGKPD
jgi:hypothetical protein